MNNSLNVLYRSIKYAPNFIISLYFARIKQFGISEIVLNSIFHTLLTTFKGFQFMRNVTKFNETLKPTSSMIYKMILSRDFFFTRDRIVNECLRKMIVYDTKLHFSFQRKKNELSFC